jgi:hypothetical protein
MYEKGSTTTLSHIVPERQRDGPTETKTAMTACASARINLSLKGEHACEEQGIAQASIRHHQNRTKGLVKIGCQGGMRNGTRLCSLLTGFLKTSRIEAEPYVDHPPRNLTVS